MMKLYPAIDLLNGNAVRLKKGDYNQVTVFGSDPVEIAREFKAAGADRMHLVDLGGAKGGSYSAYDVLTAIKKETGLFLETGGGIRDLDTIGRCLDAGADRVILGTAATNLAFLKEAVETYGDAIAVGIDIKDGEVAVRGWLESSGLGYMDFCRSVDTLGVKTVICTDVSKDGMMAGTNRALYMELKSKFSFDLIASGGVTTLDDVAYLRDLDLHGAILGRALYEGSIDLKQAVSFTGGQTC